MAETDATAAKILQVAENLAMTQALDPNTRDGAGFSNADFPAAFALVALGDVAGCAALLQLYSRQAKAKGIKPADLKPWLGESDFSNTEARSSLSQARKGAEGTLAWVERTDGILFNGIGLSVEVKKALKASGHKVAQGWVVPKSHLASVMSQADEIAKKEELQAIADATPQVASAPTGKPVPPPLAIHYDQGEVSWTQPFSEEGVAIRGIVKRLGARFNPDTKGWTLADPVALQALLVLAQDFDAPVVGIDHEPGLDEPTEALVDEIRQGVVKVIIVGQSEHEVCYRLRSKVEGAWEKARSIGAIYDRNAFGGSIRVDKAALRDLCAKLDAFTNIDLSPFLPIISKYEVAQVQAIDPEILAAIPFNTPTGKPFFDHQREGMAFLMTLGLADARLRGGILADSMGLGKTVQSICAANARFPEGRILVVCPASLKTNWRNEIWKWLGNQETIQIMKGTSDIVGDARWVIINYDIILNYVDQLRAVGFSLLISDEAHNLRNPETQRSIAIAGCAAKRAKGTPGQPGYKPPREAQPGIAETCQQSWMLTGTPILNRTKELFNLLKIIGHPLGQDWWRFASRYCAARSNGWGMNFNGSSNLGELAAKMANCYLKRQKDLLNLPPKIQSPRPVDLTDAELNAYHDAVDAMLGRLDGQEDDACILAELNALKLQTARVKMASTVEAAREVVDEGGKVLVFTFYKEVLDALQEEFGNSCVRIDGSVSPAKRQDIVDAFQNDPSKVVFLGQIDAAGVGLTLTAAETVIVNDYPWTPGILYQAEDRCYRIGTTGTVNVYYQEAEGTFDAKLKAILDEKNTVIDAFESGADIASKARMNVVRKLLKEIKKDAAARAASAVA